MLLALSLSSVCSRFSIPDDLADLERTGGAAREGEEPHLVPVGGVFKTLARAAAAFVAPSPIIPDLPATEGLLPLGV